MALSISNIIHNESPKAPRILIHGVAGVGKTTFAAESLKPVFIITEDGMGTLQFSHFPLAKTFEQVMDALATLYSQPHDFRTLVIDSVDWLEPLIWSKACRDNGWNTIEDPGYGKGYVVALNLWREYVEGINALRNDLGMTIVQIGHTDIKRFESPEHDPYDRYQVKLHARAAALLQEHSDVVLFANYHITTTKADAGFNKKATRAVGTGERRMHTSERPAYLAKNRYNLPAELPLAWHAFAQAMPQSLRAMLADESELDSQPIELGSIASRTQSAQAASATAAPKSMPIPKAVAPRAAAMA